MIALSYEQIFDHFLWMGGALQHARNGILDLASAGVDSYQNRDTDVDPIIVDLDLEMKRLSIYMCSLSAASQYFHMCSLRFFASHLNNKLFIIRALFKDVC